MTETLRLISGREIRERSRAKSFRITFLLSLLIVVAGVVLPKVLSGSKAPLHIGVVGTITPTAQAEVEALDVVIGRQLILDPVSSMALASNELRSGQLAVVVGQDEILVKQKPDATDTSATAEVATALAAALSRIEVESRAGLTPVQATQINTAGPLPIVGLTASRDARARERYITLTGVVLLYAFESLFGVWILIGVVEEKSSRVVEILLSTVRPTQLLAGKILGIGALALAEGGSVAAAAFIAERVSGSNVLRGDDGGIVLALVGWFLLGYAFYSALFAAAGSLVGRLEEVQNASFPVTLPLLIAYISSFSSLTGNVTPLQVVLSFLPPTAAISMPMRIAAGPVPLWQVLLSIGLLIAGAVAALRFAAVVYSGAILRTGRRITWREALQTARS